MIEGSNNLDAAEKALRNAYQQIALECRAFSSNGRLLDTGSTIVHIMPKGRRVESGWYKAATWTDKSTQLVEALDIEANDVAPSMDEVFIAGEALAGTPREIVNLLFHQFVHQYAGVESTTTYHGRTFMHFARALGVFEVERHSTQGWVEFDYSMDLDGVLGKIAASLDRSAFDIYRHPETTRVGSGKMRLWKCQCYNGPSVYTGAMLHAQCRRCGHPFRYAHKDRHDVAVEMKVQRAGEEVWGG
jgi:hypothetical protein